MLQKFLRIRKQLPLSIEEQRKFVLDFISDPTYGSLNLMHLSQNIESGRNRELFSLLILGKDIVKYLRDNNTSISVSSKDIEEKYLAIKQRYDRWASRLEKNALSGKQINVNTNVIFQKIYAASKNAKQDVLNVLFAEHLKKDDLSGMGTNIQINICQNENFYFSTHLQELFIKSKNNNFAHQGLEYITEGDDLIEFFKNTYIKKFSKTVDTDYEIPYKFYVKKIDENNIDKIDKNVINDLIKYFTNINIEVSDIKTQDVCNISNEFKLILNEKINFDSIITEDIFSINDNYNLLYGNNYSIYMHNDNITISKILDLLTDDAKKELTNGFNSIYKKIKNGENYKDELFYKKIGEENFHIIFGRLAFIFVNNENLNLDYITDYINNSIGKIERTISQYKINEFIYKNENIPLDLKFQYFNRLNKNDKDEDNLFNLKEFVKHNLPFEFIIDKDFTKLKKEEYGLLARIVNRTDCPREFIDVLLKNKSITIASIVLAKKDINYDQAFLAANVLKDTLFKYRQRKSNITETQPINSFGGNSYAQNQPMKKYDYWAVAMKALDSFQQNIDKYKFSETKNGYDICEDIKKFFYDKQEIKMFFTKKELSKILIQTDESGVTKYYADLSGIANINVSDKKMAFNLAIKEKSVPEFLYDFLQKNTELKYYISDINFILSNIKVINEDIVELFLSEDYKHKSTKILRHPSLNQNLLEKYLDLNTNAWYVVADALKNPNLSFDFLKSFNTRGLDRLDKAINDSMNERVQSDIKKLEFLFELKNKSVYSKEFISLLQEVKIGNNIFTEKYINKNDLDDLNDFYKKEKKLSYSKEDKIIKDNITKSLSF